MVLLSQLNRLSATGVPRAPSLSDLRGSGSIEQDADVVIFPHRPYYYDANQPPGEAQWVLAKHRNGPIGVVNLGWHGAYVRFEEHVTDWRPVKPTYYSGNNINYQGGDDL